MLPKISIVTVVRNAPEALNNTIVSVSNQTYKNIEYIIVDGNSNDNTIQIIQKNKAKITKWISEPDNGLYFAMNKSLSMATGDFILFMNAGDLFISNNTIEQIAQLMDVQNMIYFGNTLIRTTRFSWYTRPALNDINKVTDKHNKFLPHHQSIFYPKEYYKIEKYDTSFSIVADIDFTMRASATFPKKHLNINLIISELGGFGIAAFATYKRTFSYWRETNLMFKKNSHYYSFWNRITLIPKYLVKYLAYQIGGFELINFLIMKQNYNSN